MTSDAAHPPQKTAGARGRRVSLFPWIVGAVLTPVAAEWLGLSPPLAAVGLLALGGIATALLTWPLEAAAWLPVLLPPPEFAKMFVYEVLLLGFAAAIVLAARRHRQSWIWRLHPAQVAVLALFGWAATTVFWIHDPWWWMFGVRKLAIGVIAFLVAGVLARQLPEENVVLGVLGGAMSLAVATFVPAILHSNSAASNSALRIKATDLGWGSSNFIAALLILMLPTVLLVALHARRALWRVLAWTTLPLMATVMALGASRGGSLLLILVTLAAVARERSSPRTLILLGVLVASLVAVLVSPLGTPLLLRFVDPRELGSIVIRLMFFREGWRRLVTNFPLGIGQGQGFTYPDHLGTEDPHNYFLVVGSELGLVGLVLWAIVLVVLWRAAGRIMRRPGMRPVGEALRATLVFSQINSLFEPTFQGLQYHFLFYWICGVYLGAFDAEAFGVAARRTSPATSVTVTKPVSA